MTKRAFALVLVLVLAGCGRSGQSGTAPTESPPSTIATATVTTPPALTEQPATQADASLPVGLIDNEPRPADAGRSADGGVGPGSTNLERAREAMLAGRPAEVRQLLETKVRGGRATVDEARLVRAACKQMGDNACKDAIDAKYPALRR